MKKKLKGEPIPLAYYGRHNLPQVKTKIISMATIINRDFYKSLRKRGRTHYQILRMIQPERLDQFTKDIQSIHNALDLKPARRASIPFWKKLMDKFKLLFTLSLVVLTVPVLGQVPKTDIVSVVSPEKDTLFLANNALGCEIMDVWVNYPADRPVIILKSEEWIIRENIIRKKEKKE
tara:strand:+ start:873 stop:1403 length:531 start_codon:yes stop_codon:yes gene_type:complete